MVVTNLDTLYVYHTYVRTFVINAPALLPTDAFSNSSVESCGNFSMYCSKQHDNKIKYNTCTYIHTCIDNNNVECLAPRIKIWYVNDKDMILAIKQRYIGQNSKQTS